MKKILLFLVILFSNSVYSENSSRLYEKGVQQAKSGNLKQAELTFINVIKLSPYYTLGHYGLGKIYLFMPDRLKESERELRVAVKLDDNLSKGHFYLGICYMFQKKYIYSIKSFWKAYQVDNNCIESLYNIGAIYDIIGNEYKSKKYFLMYKEALEKEEDDDIFDF